MQFKIKRKRKLNCIGGYSYILTLPKLWIDNNLLSRGDEVEFTMNNDNSLTLKAIKS